MVKQGVYALLIGESKMEALVHTEERNVSEISSFDCRPPARSSMYECSNPASQARDGQPSTTSSYETGDCGKKVRRAQHQRTHCRPNTPATQGQAS